MVRIADLETGNYWRHMGMVTVPSSDGKILVEMKVTEELKQFYGNVHGGAIAGLLDTSIAVAVNQLLDSEEGASTVEMKLNYLRPVKSGTLLAESKIIHKGKKTVVGQCEIKDDEGNMVAFGTGTFMVTRLINRS